MRILVTGGSGFIGSHIVDVLLENGHDVVNMDIKEPHRPDMTFVKGSILDHGLIDTTIKDVDVVYHIGGFSNINFVKEHPVETIELNLLSTTYLLNACRKRGNILFIYASSVYAFDRNGHLYTTSKASSERIIEDFHSLYDIPYIILRFGTVYGPRNRGADVVYLFVKNAIERKPITINGDGNQQRNFMHVRDIAEASVLALARKECLNKILVIASNQSIAIKDLALKVKENVNSESELIFKPDKRELDYRGEITGIKETFELLNWKQKRDIDFGIQELKKELE